MRIPCLTCGELTHSIVLHLKESHKEMTLQDYQSTFPKAELMSESMKLRVAQKRDELQRTNMAMTAPSSVIAFEKHHVAAEKVSINKVFGLRKSKGTQSTSGDDVLTDVFKKTGEYSDLIPDIDDNYIFQIDVLKNVLMGLEENIPTLLWGHAGTGKSTCFEQVCAHTNRPYMRVQHTSNTEESHIVGQILANATGTYFEPGPLALAMKYGLVYNADEYDFAHASILAVYQPVLEGKSLVIKEAPQEWRTIKPHKNFRFVATGNTNGSGDETGLYTGTNMGNAANYSRFGITDNVKYMPKRQEAAVIAAQGGIGLNDARLLVEFAGKVRNAFAASQMSSTIGPRELIFAAKLGAKKGSWVSGIELAFINRLGMVDREVAMGLCQRIFDDKMSEGGFLESAYDEPDALEVSFS